MSEARKPPTGWTTLLFLMGQYGSRPTVTVEEVCRDYFPHLNLKNFIARCDAGQIDLRLMRAEKSQKSARSVHILDLASYIDTQRARAVNEVGRYDESGTTSKPRPAN